MDPRDLVFSLAVVVLAGIVAQVAGRLLRTPSIVFLLAFGVLLGPQFGNFVNPVDFGGGLQVVITLTVVIVLFEGAMNLHVKEILRVHTSVRGLVTIGFLFTWGAATTLARLLLDVPWAPAALFGALVAVTGPTVIKPLMRVIPVRREIRTMLDAEGILADPVGILAAVLSLELAVVGAAHLEEFAKAVGVGVLVGGAVGWGLGYLTPRSLGRVEPIKNLLVLATVFFAYGIAEAAAREAGIVAVIAAGLAIQHGVKPHSHELRDFHEQLSTLLLSILFILLAANLDLRMMAGVGWPGLIVVLALMFVIRPINIFMSTRGGKATVREKIFMSWVCPRGIVAASVSSLAAIKLADAGQEAVGLTVQSMVFLTIFLTVFGQGLTAKPLAWLLRIYAADDGDVIVIGANPLARALARPFKEAGRRVVMLDTNPRRTDVARAEGFDVLVEDGSERETLRAAGIEAADTMIAATENSHVNIITAQLGKREFNVKTVVVVLDDKEYKAMDPVLARAGVHLVTGRPFSQPAWDRDLADHRARLEEIAVTGDNRPSGKLGDHAFVPDVLPLTFKRGTHVRFCVGGTELKDGDRVRLAVRGVETEALKRDLGVAS